MFWIVQSSIIQLGVRVDRRFTVPAGTAARAEQTVRETMGGTISTVGFTIGGMTHYYPPARSSS
jgi:hypothetical protein